MADLQTLRDLRERVRKATGADRELDAAICSNFQFLDEPLSNYLNPRVVVECGMIVIYAGPRQEFKVLSRLAHEITRSIDAVVALIEHVLPGYGVAMRHGGKTGIGIIYDGTQPESRLIAHERTATTPLALICAALSALISIEESKQGEG